MALSPLSSHTVHRGNSLRVLGGSRGTVSSMDGHALPGRLPELSNFYCLPGRAGGSPLAIRPRAPDSCSVEACNSSPGQESALGVRRDKAALSSGCKSHPATAPAGSNRSSYGGNEVAEAFGVRVTNW